MILGGAYFACEMYLSGSNSTQDILAAFVRWPGHVEEGRVSNELVSILDMYRTFARVADASHLVPTDRHRILMVILFERFIVGSSGPNMWTRTIAFQFYCHPQDNYPWLETASSVVL